MPPLWAATTRHLLRHPAQLALAVSGLALGVVAVTAIDVASASAQRAIQLSVEEVNGAATHQIIGSPTGLGESLYPVLRSRGWGPSIAPVVEGYSEVGGQTVLILGIDVFADPGFREFSSPSNISRPDALRRWLTEPGWVITTLKTATRIGLKREAAFIVSVAGRKHTARLLELIEAERPGLDSLMITDIATAQEWLDSVGKLSRIDVRIDDGADGEQRLQALRAQLPPGIRLITAQRRSAELAGMSAAFTTNLQALSLLALLVSAFLIFNSAGFAVVQRRALIGTLRALGVTRAQVLALILLEAAALGLAAALIGAFFGVRLAHTLVDLISRTINDLYFVVSVGEVTASPGSILKAVALGVVVAVLAALVPATEAARTPPQLGWRRSVLESRAASLARILAFASVGLAGVAGLLVLVSGRSIGAGFVALLLLLLAAACLTPAAVRTAATALARIVGERSTLVRLALAELGTSLSRTGVAVAALGVAISATIGIAVMVASFRGSLEQWLLRTLRADIYVTAPGPGFARPERTIERHIVSALLATPGVVDHSAGRRVMVESAFGPVTLDALEPAAHSLESITLLSGEPDAIWSAFRKGAVLVSEPFAYRYGTSRGDTLRLATPSGWREFPVVGIYRDYGNDRGVVLMARSTYRVTWQDDAVTSLGLYLAPGISHADMITTLRTAAGSQQALLVRSNRELRELSLQIFERTFAITHVLYWLAAGVAAVGLFAALLAFELERSRQTAILRALGVTPRGTATMIGVQSTFLGLAAGIVAIPAGLLTALVLIEVINRRAFGWRIEFQLTPEPILNALLIAAMAALLASVYPALRAARAEVATDLRDE